MSLPEYRPWADGLYRVVPGLRPLGTDFGNGEWDRRAVWRTSELDRYLENKRTAFSPVLRNGLSAEIETAAQTALALALSDYDVPTGETLDETALQFEDDLAVVTAEGEGRAVYLNVKAPSHWAPESVIGRSFLQVHGEIPGMQAVNRGSAKLVEGMVRRGPWMRFVWGVESDDRLDQHPVHGPGRDFSATGRFWVRWERQVTLPLPEVEAALFLIRVGFTPDQAISDREPLRRAVESMNPDQRRYKGLDRDWSGLLRLLS